MFDASLQTEADETAPAELRDLTRKLVFSVLLSVRRTGSTMTRALVWLALAHDERGWSVSALAEACDLDRKSVRETLRNFRQDGLVEHGRDGWRFTPDGLERRVKDYERFWQEASPLVRALIANGATNFRGGKATHGRTDDASNLC